MVSKLHKTISEFVAKKFNTYGLKLGVQFYPDLDTVTLYSKSLDLRSMFKDTDLLNLDEEQLKKIQKESYNLMLYNYGALNRIQGRMNNQNLEIYFKPLSEQDKEQYFHLAKTEEVDPGAIDFIYEKDNVDSSSNEYLVRDCIIGTLTYQFKILTYSTDMLNNFQSIYLMAFGKTKKISMEAVLAYSYREELDYLLKFSEITDASIIDYTKYGNLQQMSFSIDVEGAIFSNYVKGVKKLKEIDVMLRVINNKGKGTR